MIVSQVEGPENTLVGRDRELEVLRAALERLMAGSGTLILIGGEAGVGKTALVRQLEGLAPTVSGHCHEFSASPPYGPWLEILDELRLRGPTPEEPHFTRHVIESSAQDRHEIFTRLMQTLSHAARQQPLALILEDMHWADNASVELLQLISRRIPQHPILIVMTYRDDDLDRSKPLHRVLPNLVRDGGAERLHLQRLAQPETTEIVARRYPLPDDELVRLGEYLQHRTQGNPFFVIELLYLLEEQTLLQKVDGRWRFHEMDDPDSRQSLPALVRQVIDGRLEQLGAPARRLLQVAAVIGQDVPINLWRTLASVPDDDFSSGIERAIEAHFVQEDAGGLLLRFSHALVREVIYLSVVLPERQRLHCLAGEVLLLDPEPDPDRVAYHFARAVDARGVEWLARAGERALSVFAPRAAIEHCNLALELAGTLNTIAPIEVYRTRGNAHSMTGGFLRARKDLTTYLERAQENNDSRNEWQALQDLGQLWESKNYDRTRQFFDEALKLARGVHDDQLIAHSLNSVGNWLLNDDRPDEAMQYHYEALEFFKRAADAPAIAKTTDLLGMDHLIRGDLVTAERILSDAIADFEALGDQVGLCSALSSLMITAGSLGFDQEIPARVPVPTIQKTMQRASALAREIHWRAGEASIACIIGAYHAVRGHYDAGLEWIERGLAIAEDIEHREWTSYALDNLADVHLSLLDPVGAQRHAQRALDVARLGGSRIHEKGALATLAGAHISGGDPEAALTILGSPCPPDGSLTSVDERAYCLWHAQAVLEAGDAAQALDNVEQVMSTRLPRGDDRVSPWCARIKGEALIALGRYPEAEAALQTAREAALELDYQPDLWRIWIALGRLYTSWSRPRDASRSFSEARTIIEELAHLVPDPELRDHFLDAALEMIPGTRGLSPFQAARLEAGGLTPRQRDVAVLIAEGLSNRVIADTLSISERTVEGHVSAIMTAMDFSSRAQIAAWAVGQGLTKPGASG